MAGAKNHEYHIVNPSIWPLIGAFSALAMSSAAWCMWMHSHALRRPMSSALGVLGVLLHHVQLVVGRDRARRTPAITRRSSSFTCATA